MAMASLVYEREIGVAGTKFWSLRLEFVAKTPSSHDATSPIMCADLYASLSSPLFFQWCIDTNSPRSIYQYSNMVPRLSGQSCKFFKFLLSFNSQKRLGYKEHQRTLCEMWKFVLKASVPCQNRDL